MTFKEYLESKKIDPKLLFEGNADLFNEWKTIFSQVSPKSFTQQKLYLINKIRREFPLQEKKQDENVTKKAPLKVKIGGKPMGVKIGKK